jgi:hypothetical protein
LRAARDKYLGKHSEDEREINIEWYKHELTNLYSQFNPSKVKDVDRMLGTVECAA